MTDILVLHGPNLNLLGEREPGHYGSKTLSDINLLIEGRGEAVGLTVSHLQSNAEHELINAIQGAKEQQAKIILFNPAGLTHTSIALRDALLGVAIPFIEVHLSNPHAREPFRQHSYFSDIAIGTVSGFGVSSYLFAVDAAIEFLQSKQHTTKV